MNIRSEAGDCPDLSVLDLGIRETAIGIFAERWLIIRLEFGSRSALLAMKQAPLAPLRQHRFLGPGGRGEVRYGLDVDQGRSRSERMLARFLRAAQCR